MLTQLIARHRDAKLAADNTRLRAELIEARAERTKLAADRVKAIRRADGAEQALEDYRAEIRSAHAGLVAQVSSLRAEVDGRTPLKVQCAPSPSAVRALAAHLKATVQ